MNIFPNMHMHIKCNITQNATTAICLIKCPDQPKPAATICQLLRLQEKLYLAQPKNIITCIKFQPK